MSQASAINRVVRPSASAEQKVAPAQAPAEAGAPARFGWGANLIGFATLAAIAFGFSIKNYEVIVPGEGIGYKLGLAGGIMMLLLLAYPAFKRTRFFRGGTAIAFWFNWHMLLGVVGPLLILFHANFSLGAMNSNVALFCMILVAASGVVGRYIYRHVHGGMTGAKLDLGTLLAQATRLMSSIEGDVGGSGGTISKALADFSKKAMPKDNGIASNFLNALTMASRSGAARRRIMREVKAVIHGNTAQMKWSRDEARQHLLAAQKHVDEFISAVTRASQLAFWERMFASWHVLHVPLFFLLLASGVVHVIAVHIY